MRNRARSRNAERDVGHAHHRAGGGRGRDPASLFGLPSGKGLPRQHRTIDGYPGGAERCWGGSHSRETIAVIMAGGPPPGEAVESAFEKEVWHECSAVDTDCHQCRGRHPGSGQLRPGPDGPSGQPQRALGWCAGLGAAALHRGHDLGGPGVLRLHLLHTVQD